MTIYDVGDERFFSLREAKAEMKRTGNKGYKTKVYSDGESIFCGEIDLNGSNRCYIAGVRNSNSY